MQTVVVWFMEISQRKLTFLFLVGRSMSFRDSIMLDMQHGTLFPVFGRTVKGRLGCRRPIASKKQMTCRKAAPACSLVGGEAQK